MSFLFSFGRKNQKFRPWRRPFRLRPTFETLEVREVPAGLVSGTVFQELNVNGSQDTGEIGVAGRTVYVDANNNGHLDSTETSTTTDATGQYSLSLDPRQYVIRVVSGANEISTTPTGGIYDVTVT